MHGRGGKGNVQAGLPCAPPKLEAAKKAGAPSMSSGSGGGGGGAGKPYELELASEVIAPGVALLPGRADTAATTGRRGPPCCCPGAS